ncbi:hypothetical protein BRADI_1g45086v3, partial [Brachypodium distachyon]
LLNTALRARWRWLERVDDSKPWKEFAVRTTPEVRDLFEAATSSWVGDGGRTQFWKDRWLERCRIRDEYPSLVAVVRPRFVNTGLVREGLQGAWLTDVGPDLGEVALAEFLAL